MDARDYFEQIVKPNYYEAKDNPNDLRSVWNAILTMNTVAGRSLRVRAIELRQR